jgi:hypothetical protein
MCDHLFLCVTDAYRVKVFSVRLSDLEEEALKAKLIVKEPQTARDSVSLHC